MHWTCNYVRANYSTQSTEYAMGKMCVRFYLFLFSRRCHSLTEMLCANLSRDEREVVIQQTNVHMYVRLYTCMLFNEADAKALAAIMWYILFSSSMQERKTNWRKNGDIHFDYSKPHNSPHSHRSVTIFVFFLRVTWDLPSKADRP